MADDTPVSEPENIKDASKPCFELYIKASLKDGESKGSCPICQQWFMVAYILAEKECVSFKVFTVSAASPPSSFKDKLGKIQPANYPVVLGLSGENINGASLESITVDHTDDVSKFFEEVNGRYPDLNEKSPKNNNACAVFLNLQRDFNTFLRDEHNDGKKLLSTLGHINDHLKSLDTKFLLSDDLSFADCSLLPKLQHIRVAGGYYKNFRIPEEYSGIWDYLEYAYAMNAFIKTLPTDQDIMLQHEDKIGQKKIRELYKNFKRPKLQPESYTTSVVRTISKNVENHVENGREDEEEQNRMPSPDSCGQEEADTQNSVSD